MGEGRAKCGTCAELEDLHGNLLGQCSDMILGNSYELQKNVVHSNP